MLVTFIRLVACTCLSAGSAFAKTVPVYVAEIDIDCSELRYDMPLATTHVVDKELRFLLGPITENIRLNAVQIGDEHVRPTDSYNSVAVGRAAFGIRTTLEASAPRGFQFKTDNPGFDNLAIKNVIEIRRADKFCGIMSSGIEIAIYVDNLHAVNIRLVEDNENDLSANGKLKAVSAASDVDRKLAIDLIGIRYYGAVEQLFSNHFHYFLDWQSRLAITYNYYSSAPLGNDVLARYADNASNIDGYFAFYEEQQLYKFVLPDDSLRFRLSDGPFDIEFSEKGHEMYWQGSSRSVCFKNSNESTDMPLWFC